MKKRKIKCTAYRSCRRKARYFAPGDWCHKHWKMWWIYGVKGKTLPYMKEGRKQVLELGKHLERRTNE